MIVFALVDSPVSVCGVLGARWRSAPGLLGTRLPVAAGVVTVAPSRTSLRGSQCPQLLPVRRKVCDLVPSIVPLASVHWLSIMQTSSWGSAGVGDWLIRKAPLQCPLPIIMTPRSATDHSTPGLGVPTSPLPSTATASYITQLSNLVMQCVL